MYHDSMFEHKQLSYYFGKVEIVRYTVVNVEGRAGEFRVVVQDAEGEGGAELSVVWRGMEWRHYCEKGGYPFPKSFEAVSEGGIIKLAPNESVELLFKFLSFRKSPAEIGDYHNPTPETASRLINVLILNTQTTSLLSGFTLLVHPNTPTISRSLILF